jgi:uncharacterized membrane protein
MQVVAYGLFVLGLILGMFLCLLTVIIADMRDAEHATAITWVNLLFGWTVLGCVAALNLGLRRETRATAACR